MPSSVRSYHQASFKTNQYCLHLPHDDWRHNTRWPPLTFCSGFFLLPLPFIDATLLEFLNLRAKKKSMLPHLWRCFDFQGLELGLNPVALVAVGTILLIYIIGVIFCHRLDRSDLRRISMVPLCGCDGAFKYHITVITGRQIGAGQCCVWSADGCCGLLTLFFTR